MKRLFLSLALLASSAGAAMGASLPKMWQADSSGSYQEITLKPDGKGRLSLGFSWDGSTLYDPSGAKCRLTSTGFGQTTWQVGGSSPMLPGATILVKP